MIRFFTKLFGSSQQPAPVASQAPVQAAPQEKVAAKPEDSTKAFVVATQNSGEFAVVIDSYGLGGPATTFGWTKDKSRASVLTGSQADALKAAADKQDEVFQKLFQRAPAVYNIVDIRAQQ